MHSSERSTDDGGHFPGQESYFDSISEKIDGIVGQVLAAIGMFARFGATEPRCVASQ
jgi:hypothetical protein